MKRNGHESTQELYTAQLQPADHEMSARMGLGNLLRWVFASLSSPDETRARARLGRMALRARTAATLDQRRAVIDPARRADAARAGHAQAPAVVDAVRPVWS